MDVTIENILLLNLKLKEPPPHNNLPVIWFISTVLGKLWDLRQAGKPSNLHDIKASVIAKCNLTRRTKYNDIAIIIDVMIG